MQVRFFTFSQFHNKKNIGSTRIRAYNLIKYWPEAGLYKYGEFPDVLVFQKVYCTPDYKFPANFENLKILDMCDPDWMENAYIKETLDVVNGVTCSSEPLAEFLRQLTDKPVKTIPDRHDIQRIPELKIHKGEAKNLIWFGYNHNSETIKPHIKFFEREGYNLTIMSEDDPIADRWAQNPEEFSKRCTFVKYPNEPLEALSIIRNHDLAVLPSGSRPRDRFKSNNKDTFSWLAGVPVVKTIEDLERLKQEEPRNKEAKEKYELAKKEYNCVKSVQELKEFIKELQNANSDS